MRTGGYSRITGRVSAAEHDKIAVAAPQATESGIASRGFTSISGGEREDISVTQHNQCLRLKPEKPQNQNKIMPLSASEQPIQNQQKHWYAMWVYRSLVEPIIALCDRSSTETYRPVRLAERFTDNGIEYSEEAVVPNLLFVKTTAEHLGEIKRLSKNRGSAYCYPGTYVPAPISDSDMEIFMLVAKRGAHRLEQVDFPIDKGDRVRVTDGIFKGAEGYIRRVHGSRRLVVAIEGVVAVAVTHIPRQFLEKINPGPCPSQTAAAV